MDLTKQTSAFGNKHAYNSTCGLVLAMIWKGKKVLLQTHSYTANLWS